jgi:Ser/Thr protein kinase RdoA (MazF antagonist)
MVYKKSGQLPATKTAVSAALSKYGISDFAFSSATSGIENASFIITVDGKNQYVLRVYRTNKKSYNDITLEVAFMQRLHDASMPVPEIYPNISLERITTLTYGGVEWQAILMQYMPGQHAESYTQRLIEELATYQARFHVIGENFSDELPPTGSIDELRETEFIHLITADKLTNPDVEALIQRGRDFTYRFSDSVPAGYSHFDYDSENVLSDDEGNVTGILDFDDLQYGPLVMCLAYTLWAVLITSDDIETVRYYVKKYEEIRPLSSEEKKAIPKVMLFRHYVLAALEVLRGDMDKDNTRHCLKYEKYLSRTSL